MVIKSTDRQKMNYAWQHYLANTLTSNATGASFLLLLVEHNKQI